MRFRTTDTPDHYIRHGDIRIRFSKGFYETDDKAEIALLEKHDRIVCLDAEKPLKFNPREPDSAKSKKAKSGAKKEIKSKDKK